MIKVRQLCKRFHETGVIKNLLTHSQRFHKISAMLQRVTNLIFNYLCNKRYSISCRSSSFNFGIFYFLRVAAAKKVFTKFNFSCNICHKAERKVTQMQCDRALQNVTRFLKTGFCVTSCNICVTSCNRFVTKVCNKYGSGFQRFVTRFIFFSNPEKIHP